MIDATEDIEPRLARLAQQTASIEPGPLFTAQVMAKLEAEPGGWLRRIPTLWYRALPVAMLLTTVSAVWAYRNARALDAHTAVAADAEDAAEMDW